MISVFVAESSDSVREALRELITEMDGVELAGMAGDACNAIEGYLERAQMNVPPQVLILDTQLAEGSGMGVLRFIKRGFPLTCIVMLCDCASAMYRERCASQGADYFFDKATEFSRVREVLHGLAQAGDFSNIGVAA
jgi:DNA-binding NarL/FixJ family response regulator